MKKIGLLLLLAAGSLKLASAQTINIAGTVKTADGDALHLAFVQDKQYKAGVYTDSLGNFGLTVYVNSKLKVTCAGFRDTLISIDGKTTFAIILNPSVNIVASRLNNQTQSQAPATVNDNIGMATFRDELLLNEPMVPQKVELDRTMTKTVGDGGARKTIVVGVQQVQGLVGGVDMAQGAIFPVFHHKDETQGSRYLYNTWVHGYVVNQRDSLIQTPVLFFNYDKIGGNLLLTRDKHAAIELYRETVKSFTLFDALNQPSAFTMVPEIDKGHFVQVISSGNNYKIYKSIKTRFVTANYTTDGVASSGNNFDSYEDEFTYYILNVKTNQLQKISLKKKALKQAFIADETKADDYFKTNGSDIDDNYLAALGDYMNKQ